MKLYQEKTAPKHPHQSNEEQVRMIEPLDLILVQGRPLPVAIKDPGQDRTWATGVESHGAALEPGKPAPQDTNLLRPKPLNNYM